MTGIDPGRAAAEKSPPSDPLERIESSSVSHAQKLAIGTIAAISALDGYDLLSISFVAPALRQSFGFGSAELGLLLSAALVGAFLGSVLLAPLADVVGRRPLILLNLVIVAIGMALTAVATSLPWLCLIRTITGIGVGAMVVVINPMAAELANRRTKALAITVMVAGYPVGAALGGFVSAYLLRTVGWHAVFWLGVIGSVVILVMVARFVPESLNFLLNRRNDRTLDRVNDVLHRFGHPAVTTLPPVRVRHSVPYREIFRRGQLATTLILVLASFLYASTNYYFLTWQPTLLVESGIAPSAAAAIAGAGSLVGAVVCVVVGVFSRRVTTRLLAIAPILLLGLAVIVFGALSASGVGLVVSALVAGALVPAATAGVYIVTADAYTARNRATGTGVVLGAGRVASAIAPAIAGALFAAGIGEPSVAVAFGLCAIVAAVVMVGRARTPVPGSATIRGEG